MSGSSPSPPEWVSLAQDERVWLRVSPSRNLVLAALVAGSGLLLVMSVAVSAMRDLSTGRLVSFTALLVIVGLLVAASLVTQRLEYVLTSERACVGAGLRSKRTSSVALRDVQDVSVEQSWWHRLANVGTVRFVTAGGDLAFALVENPAAIQRQVLQVVDLED